jgi:gamma-glutamylcysteine synthetase
VRLKNYIEIRCCDRLPDVLSFAVAALIKGILYSPETLAETGVWLKDISGPIARLGLAEAAQHGYQGRMNGRPLEEWAVEAVRLGRKGLERLSADWTRGATVS